MDVNYGASADGTGGGRTVPLATHPRGAISFSLQTESADKSLFYERDSRTFRGIRLTHFVAPDVNDFGALLIMPQSGEADTDPDTFFSDYEQTEMRPNCFKGRLKRYAVSYELVPCVYGGFIKFTFDGKGERRVILLGIDGETEFEKDGEGFGGFTSGGARYCCADFKQYFHLTASKPVRFEKIRGGAVLEFEDEEITLKIAASSISREQAKLLHGREFRRDMETAKQDCRFVWNIFFDRAKLTARGKEQAARKKKFYTCLYRTLVYPRRFFESDAAWKRIHLNLSDGTVAEGAQYTGGYLSATYRTAFPLFSLIAPDVYEEVCLAIMTTYEETGRLPRRRCLDEMYRTVGMPIEPIFSDAIVKEIIRDKKTAQRMLEALNKAYIKPKDKDFRYGRFLGDVYAELGYIPCDKTKDSVAETVEYSFGDHCVYRAANKLGDRYTESKRARGLLFHRNLFDPESENLTERDSFGRFRRGKSSPSAALSPMHDIRGMNELLGGGAEKAADRLLDGDIGELFSDPSNYHLPYVYAELGNREKTELAVKRIADECFSDKGYPADEKGGALSAWYVLACLGLYPMCSDWIVTKPLFDSARICIGSKQVTLCGKTDISRISHEDLSKIKIL